MDEKYDTFKSIDEYNQYLREHYDDNETGIINPNPPLDNIKLGKLTQEEQTGLNQFFKQYSIPK